ncbi:hypothetical protein [Gryllotalpicola koreensis]|uniref:Uncharacterized protein n=1 Tax=Gryllotalpicola koreensis TaxID=993086 RepID=A0ABP7ZQ31_9MICO
MIARPGHSIDAGETDAATPPVPAVAGLDVGASVQRVVTWGGDRARYLRALGRALAAVPGLADDRAGFTDAAAVAGWRAGTLGLRADALSRIERALSSSLPGQASGPAPALAAALGLPGGTDATRAARAALAAFAAGQHADRFHWPGWEAGGYVLARLGGFIGLGGPWQEPPIDPEPLGPGRWRVTVAGHPWHIECDLFGHVISPETLAAVDETPGRAELAVSAYSYLAIVHSPRAAA